MFLMIDSGEGDEGNSFITLTLTAGNSDFEDNGNTAVPIVMTGSRSESQHQFNLFLLPREKPVLDFMLQELSQRSGPERYELIEALLNMYKTSAGFDPFALSKGRFRRIKAAEFRQVLLEIDREIGEVMQSEAYRRLQQSHLSTEALFREFMDLSQGAGIYPARSMTGELEQLQNHLNDAEMPELQLLFYRQHRHFMQELFISDAPLQFLDHYDTILARQSQLQMHFRMGFQIRALELEADKGILHPEKTGAAIPDLERMLLQERSASHRIEMVWNLVRLTLLTGRPSESIQTYLSAIAADLNSFLNLLPEHSIRLLSTMASWYKDAGRERRMEWLQLADEKARQLDLHELRPGFRFVLCHIECDAGNVEGALKALNEAEHLTYKTPARSLEARNNWVLLCEYRTILFALQCMSGNNRHLDQFGSLRSLASDMGRHRHEIGVMQLEWQGLEAFVLRRWKESCEMLERALSYREEQKAHPWCLISRCLLALMAKGKQRREAAVIALELEQTGLPFYSSAAVQLLRLAAVFSATKAKASRKNAGLE
jgi:hypothetical protein